MGIKNPDSLLMILGLSTDLKPEFQDIVAEQLLIGFQQKADQAKVAVEGGQTVYNPWIMMGGCVSAVVKPNQFIVPNKAKPGDLIILTKPLGTQIAVNAFQWIQSQSQKSKKITQVVTKQTINQCFEIAEKYMCTLNLDASLLMHKYNAHACTDITGFGILGHADYLAKAQKEQVKFVIDKIPLIRNVIKMQKINRDFKILEGKSAETSGGLFICLEQTNAVKFVQQFKKMGKDCWIIGRVQKSSQRMAVIQDKFKIIE